MHVICESVIGREEIMVVPVARCQMTGVISFIIISPDRQFRLTRLQFIFFLFFVEVKQTRIYCTKTRSVAKTKGF